MRQHLVVLTIGAAIVGACAFAGSSRRDASRARDVVRPGMAWPEAVVAAEEVVSRENPVICSCVPARGEGFYFFRSLGGEYLIQSPEGTTGYKTQKAWRDAMRDFSNIVCDRLLVTVRREQFTATVDPAGKILTVSGLD
jgi:hypothetical protein